jgi:hypothetical protein
VTAYPSRACAATGLIVGQTANTGTIEKGGFSLRAIPAIGYVRLLEQAQARVRAAFLEAGWTERSSVQTGESSIAEQLGQ